MEHKFIRYIISYHTFIENGPILLCINQTFPEFKSSEKLGPL